MTSVAVKEKSVTEIPENEGGWNGEVVALCPSCKALQTLWIDGDTILPTRKFVQRGTRVYHDCFTPEPCRLFRIL